jgi:hypothetical protein
MIGAYLQPMRWNFPIAAMLLVAAPVSAMADCPSSPDGPETGYVVNTTARAVCLQHELSDRANDLAIEAEVDAALATIELELQRQRQLIVTRMPPTHGWP